MAVEERVVKHAVFSYTDPDGVYRTALRGETVSIEGAELERGERFDVFFDEGDVVDGSGALDGALVGDDEVLDGIVDEVDLVDAIAGLDEERRAALVAALASTATPAVSSPAGAQPTPLDLDAAAAAASGADELSSTGVVDGAVPERERPAQTANKAVWLEFRGLGDLTEEQASAITKDQLKDDEFMASYQRPAGDPGTEPGA